MQTLGSDTWFRIDKSAQLQRAQMVDMITHPTLAYGLLSANWTVDAWTGQSVLFDLAQAVDPSRTYAEYAYVGTGCYRSPAWPWYLQAAPWYASIPCIPIFAVLLAFWNGQNWRTARHRKQLLIMTGLGCLSYVANKGGEILIGGTVGSVTGAFAVSLAGGIYEQVFHGFSFAMMVPGVLFLVPVSEPSSLLC